VCKFDQLFLLEGHYRLNVLIRGGGERQDFVEAAAMFDVEAGQLDGRPMKFQDKSINICMPHRWMVPTNI